MPKLKKAQGGKAVASSAVSRSEAVRPEEKIARMLAILALQHIKGRSEQATMLRIGGFSHNEIAQMLDTSEQAVSSLLYQAKQKRGRS